MTKPGNAKAERTEQVEDLDALDDQVAKAAEAAATAAAHAVAAAKAVEEISQTREEAEATASKSEDTATTLPPGIDAPSESTEPPGESPLSPETETEPSFPTSGSPAVADEESGDLLDFDSPHVAMSSVLSRLALISLVTAAAIFAVSLLLVATVPKGTVLDLIVLIGWLGVGVLSLGGFALLIVAGITKIIRSARDQA